MKDFYPEIEPYQTHRLQVSDLHNLHIEEAGNPKGVPVIFLHGGPGGGIMPSHRRFFDPSHYRIIHFDQRGCGKSTPFAELRENTTWDLVEDIEKIREFFNIKQWHVFGGSWGSTLSLAYGITHPERCASLTLRGIFLCRPSEIQWFYQDGASHIFPDFWEAYREGIPTDERGDFVKAYYKRLTSENESVRIDAARRWSQWESATSFLHVSPESIKEMEDPRHALPFARIECHYFINNAFFKTNNYLLENIQRIHHIPGFIAQGRYDVVCPAKSAWELHKAWPKSRLTIVPDAGHAAAETGTRSALVEEMDRLRDLSIKP